MLTKKRPSLKKMMEKEDVRTFEKVQEEKTNSEKPVKEESGKSKAGRKKLGKSKAENRITFYVDDEQLEYLISMVNYKEKLSTPSAVAKKLFLTDYELHNKN